MENLTERGKEKNMCKKDSYDINNYDDLEKYYKQKPDNSNNEQHPPYFWQLVKKATESSVGCPYCKQSKELLKKIVEERCEQSKKEIISYIENDLYYKQEAVRKFKEQREQSWQEMNAACASEMDTIKVLAALKRNVMQLQCSGLIYKPILDRKLVLDKIDEMIETEKKIYHLRKKWGG